MGFWAWFPWNMVRRCGHVARISRPHELSLRGASGTMGKRKKRHERCAQCRLHVEQCLCDSVPRIAIDTRIVLVMHRRELSKPTNTGRLALLALEDCQLHIRGHQERPADLSVIPDAGRRTWLLFPREDAVELSHELVAADPRPITLIVPDGTWGQARAAVRREPDLDAATAVLLSPGQPSRYRLRQEPVPGGLATVEAIARALGVIEGPDVQRKLERLFDTMVERTLETRES